MADVKWIKITTDIFDDEKILLIESMPDAYAIITVWFKLLCLAGKQNNSGVFMMSNQIAYTDKMLATIFRMKESTVALALQTFEQFGMIEIVDGVITIPNWEKHQSLDVYEQKKERDRIYQAERRKKQKLIANKSCDCQTIESSYVTNKSSDCKTIESSYVEKNRSIEEEKEEEKIKIKNKEEKTYSADANLNDAIIAFIDYRKKIKKPMTDRAIELLINKLNKMDSSIDNQIEILNQSIVNGWQGIFPLKEEKGKEQKGRLDWIDDI